jgi:hypothetical protein
VARFLYTTVDPNGSTFAPGFAREANGYRFTYWDPSVGVRTFTEDRGPTAWPVEDPELIRIVW